MTRLAVQLPAPLYQRLKEIAHQQDWSLSEVMRKAAEHFTTRFPQELRPQTAWRFPTLDGNEDFLTDPAQCHPEIEAILERNTP